jgi:hypothetical protein
MVPHIQPPSNLDSFLNAFLPNFTNTLATTASFQLPLIQQVVAQQQQQFQQHPNFSTSTAFPNLIGINQYQLNNSTNNTTLPHQLQQPVLNDSLKNVNQNLF